MATVAVLVAGWFGIEAVGASHLPADGQVRPAANPCRLLTYEQAERLSPGNLGTDEGDDTAADWHTDCAWNPGASESGLTLLKVSLATYSSPAKARAAFAATPKNDAADTPVALKKVGDQMRAVDEFDDGYELFYRQDRNVVHISYSVIAPDLSDRQQRANLQSAAEWTDQALRKLDPPGTPGPATTPGTPSTSSPALSGR